MFHIMKSKFDQFTLTMYFFLILCGKSVTWNIGNQFHFWLSTFKEEGWTNLNKQIAGRKNDCDIDVNIFTPRYK